METENWRPIDYLTLVLIYMSEQNEEVSLEEMDHMAAKIGVDRLVGMRTMLTDIELDEKRKIIKKLRPRFYPGEFGKQTVVENIRDLFDIDGIISERESHLLQEVKDLL